MKKIKIVVLLIFALLLTACGNSKKALTSIEFKNIMENENFSIIDAIDQFNGFTEMKEAYIALEENKNYQIEFYVMDSDDNAVKLYEYNKESFEASKGSMSAYTNFDLKNTNRYTLNTNGEFKLLSRIDNTMIYLDVNSEYKDEVMNILKKLGY